MCEVTHKKCNGCFYYYGEINECMYGEPDVPNNMKRKCAETEEAMRDYVENAGWASNIVIEKGNK